MITLTNVFLAPKTIAYKMEILVKGLSFFAAADIRELRQTANVRFAFMFS